MMDNAFPQSNGVPYTRALLLCPAAVTGGPQAIHQLACALNERSLPTRIAYYSTAATEPPFGLDGDIFFARPVVDNPCLTAFAGYGPVLTTKVRLTPELLVILPEALGHVWTRFSPAQVAIWWLALDTAIDRNTGALQQGYQSAMNADVLHLCQSAYAEVFLRDRGASRVRRLSDYTDEQFTAQKPAVPRPGKAFTFNPRRGVEAAKRFLARPETEAAVPLSDLSRPQMIDCFGSCPVYLDFGHFPGKDRMPREAAASGSVVLIHRKGAGALNEDFPLADRYKFGEDDIDSGRLNSRLSELLADPAPAWGEQADFRAAIRQEKLVFDREVDGLLPSGYREKLSQTATRARHPYDGSSLSLDPAPLSGAPT